MLSVGAFNWPWRNVIPCLRLLTYLIDCINAEEQTWCGTDVSQQQRDGQQRVLFSRNVGILIFWVEQELSGFPTKQMTTIVINPLHFMV